MQTVTLILSILIVFVISGPPFCRKPHLPFKSKGEAFGWLQMYIRSVDQYYNADRHPSYNGKAGFNASWGQKGTLFNESSQFVSDGKTVSGYYNILSKVVFSQHMMSMIPPTKDIKLSHWSSYELNFSNTRTMVLNFANFTNTRKEVQEFGTLRFFDDDSGIIQIISVHSSSGMHGLVAGFMETTQFAADILGYLDDDDITYDNKYIPNPIQLIFITIFCTLTVFVAVFVYILLKCWFNKMSKLN